MARALETDPINQLEENLQCTVCLEPLKDPRTLPCFHSFCKVCLERVVKTCRDKAPRGRPIRQFPCPNCRETFTLDPDKQVADMRRNHFICNMVKATAVLDRGTGVPCSHNCSQSYSVARCVNCEKFLCRECLTIHNSYRGHNGHSVLTMEELSKPENRKKIKDKMYCNEHQGKTLKVYCETCDQLICKDCMDFKHVKPNHSCFLVKDVANNYKELLASNNNAMEDVLTEGNAFVERLTLTTEGLGRDAEDAKSKIVQRKELMAKKVVKMLDQKAETLLNEVDQIHKGERAKLDKQTRETKLFVENVQRSVQLSKKLVDQGTEEEIISSQKMMLDNANSLRTKRQEYFKATIPVHVVKFSYTACDSETPLNEEILRGLAKSLGEVDKRNTIKNFRTSKTWDDIGMEVLNMEQRNSLTDSTETLTWKNNMEGKDNRDKTRKILFGRAARQTKFDNRRSANSLGKVNEGNKDYKQQRTDTSGLISATKECPICLYNIADKKTLDKCGHSFCAGCIDRAFKDKKICPVCGQVYGPLTGNQPPGKMIESYESASLPGFYSSGTIVISYKFPNGTQGPDHPNPGKPYQGTNRTAYLPDNEEGRKVQKLLRKSFDQKLTFTIGRSITTGKNNCIIWNGMHHKTSITGGPTDFGYPDPDYLKEVQDDLAAKGITE